MIPEIAIRHHMPEEEGVYLKETRIPKGVRLAMHEHVFAHKSLLASGRVLFFEGNTSRLLDAPCVVHVRHGVRHSVTALEDSVWYCIHHSFETDVAKIDESIVSQDKEAIWRG